jgi:hypothetical protein
MLKRAMTASHVLVCHVCVFLFFAFLCVQESTILSRTASCADLKARQRKNASIINRLAANPAAFGENAVRNHKYAPLTFLPVVLMELHQKLFNVFWLAQCVIILIPGMAPTNPISTILGFAFVIFLGMAKIGYEDYQRLASHLVSPDPSSSTALHCHSLPPTCNPIPICSRIRHPSISTF